MKKNHPRRYLRFRADWEHLFKPPKNYRAGRFALVSMRQNEVGKLPCIPTFSNASLTLFRRHHAEHDEQIELSRSEEAEFRYQPNDGGIHVAFPSKTLIGDYICRFRVEGGNDRHAPVEQEIVVKVITVWASSKPPPPVIDDALARHVVESEV